MWKARAIMRRMSMSSCAPRVLSTGMRTKSIRPEDAWLGSGVGLGLGLG